ncbi:flagellar biosynthesis anti-sigma factor FlgM [Helicobacter bilis]|uniref:flagellar biosynthesis anti-sigma factor FlgM n=1 Tax=Helicobacter bilis TaxID=37372 RepID=UPI002557DB0B|nr:flagellar biosynthesis anti-sigma factor FlgM [Helicobacter bilis]
MRIASSIAASVQQTQARERNDINRNYEKNVENKQQENGLFSNVGDKKHSDRIAQLKEDIKNGNYQINLAATSEKMAQSLLNL